MPALKQGVVGGQYAYPKGLFFGGSGLEQGSERYRLLLANRLASAEKLVAIDVHTGLGKYAEDSLLVETDDYAKLRPLFGERVTALQADQGTAYKIDSGLNSMILRLFTKTSHISSAKSSAPSSARRSCRRCARRI